MARKRGTAGSDGRLMEEKAAVNKGCSDRGGRNKRQRSGSRLEATALATGGRCWEGEERVAGDQIRRQKAEIQHALQVAGGIAEKRLHQQQDGAARRGRSGWPEIRSSGGEAAVTGVQQRAQAAEESRSSSRNQNKGAEPGDQDREGADGYRSDGRDVGASAMGAGGRRWLCAGKQQPIEGSSRHGGGTGETGKRQRKVEWIGDRSRGCDHYFDGHSLTFAGRSPLGRHGPGILQGGGRSQRRRLLGFCLLLFRRRGVGAAAHSGDPPWGPDGEAPPSGAALESSYPA
ncbi:hypothetical protein BHE74_00041470 [Ensete ventricosum]|nr:hypothetical protein GW17_00041908 [Ensete ventricosum]RWW52127.1 hypothetical protein BHE74_00041470 [Ensete ventricosum]